MDEPKLCLCKVELEYQCPIHSDPKASEGSWTDDLICTVHKDLHSKCLCDDVNLVHSDRPVSKPSEFGKSPLESIKAKCEQYQNENGIGDPEFHAILGFIWSEADKASKLTASEGWEVVLWWCEKCNQSIYVLRPEKVCTICSNPPSPLIRQSDAIAYGTRTYNDGFQHGVATAKQDTKEHTDRKLAEVRTQAAKNNLHFKKRRDEALLKLADAEVRLDGSRKRFSKALEDGMELAKLVKERDDRYRTLVEGLSANWIVEELSTLLDREVKG